MKPGIDARRWSEMCALFDEIVGLDADHRAERLDAIEAADPELRRGVEGLLAADAAADDRLAHLDHAFAAALPALDPNRDHDPLKLSGRTVAHFKVIAPLAAGGMGVVYRAQDTRLQRMIALKFPLPSHHFDRVAKERFLHEARLAGALDHPNICSIHEAGETEDGHLFLAMPLYDGETLKARLARQGALPLPDAIAIAKQIANGLGAAHSVGIVHRDVKPANAMLLRDGSVRILDFGLAKVRDLTLTTAHARMGTVAYMAPEQIQGQPVDARTDLWALGVILYEMLTGCRPFAGDYDVSVAHAIVHAEPAPVSLVRADIPSGLDDVVHKLLSKDPGARHATAASVAADLAAWSGTEAPRRPSRFEKIKRARAWKASRIAAVALPMVIAVTLSAWLLATRSTGSPQAPLRVAVLPFMDASGTEESRYLAAGLGDAIGTDLLRLRSVIVPNFVSTAGFRGTAKPLPQIARELSAAAIVTGTLQRHGDSMRVHMQLFDAHAGKPLWTRVYHRPVTDILDVQRDAAGAIVAALELDLTKPERALLARRPTSSVQAYDLYLRGKEAEIRGSPRDIFSMPADNIRDAQSLYSRARELDPNFAIARARLAMMHMYSAMKYDRTPARLEQARLEAETALRLQPGLPEAHEALAFYWASGHGDWSRAAQEWERALNGFPNNTDYHLNIGISYRNLGRWEEAVAEMQRAMELEPSYPGPAFNAALTYSRLRRYEQSVRAWDRVIELEPGDPMHKVIRGYVVIRWLGTPDTLAAVLRGLPVSWDPNGMGTWARFMVAHLQRRDQDALAIVNASRHEISFDLLTYRPRSLLRGWSFDALGDRRRARASYQEARALLSDSVAAHPGDARMRVALAQAYAGLGDREQAVREARRAMELVPLSNNSPGATAMMGGAVEVFARVGDVDAALELLELLLSMPAGREVSVPLLRVDPAYDPLRNNPRFEQMLARFSTS